VSNVKAVLACPSCSETTFGDTPAASSIVAAECRKSYSLIRGNPARSSIDLKCFARESALIGCPDDVLKTKSWASGHRSCALALVCKSRRSATIQRCNLIGRRLRERFVSQKHHLPSTLRMLRTTLTVCRAQSMSCHFSPKILTRSHPSCERDGKRGTMRSGQRSLNKCLRLLHGERTHFASGLLRDFDAIDRIIEQQTPLQCLPDRRP